MGAVQTCANYALQNLYIIFILMFIISAIYILFSIKYIREDEMPISNRLFNLAIMLFTYSVIDIYFYQIDTKSIAVFLVIVFVANIYGVTDSELGTIFKSFFWPVSIESDNYREDIIKVVVYSFLNMIFIVFVTNVVVMLVQSINIFNPSQLINQSQIVKYSALNFLVLTLVLGTFAAFYSKLEQQYKAVYGLYIGTSIIIIFWVYLYATICG